MLNDRGASQTAGDIVEAQSIVYRGQAAALMAVGFLRYRDAIKALGHKLLFPELKANSDRTPFGDVFHGDWIKVSGRRDPERGGGKEIIPLISKNKR